MKTKYNFLTLYLTKEMALEDEQFYDVSLYILDVQ